MKHWWCGKKITPENTTCTSHMHVYWACNQKQNKTHCPLKDTVVVVCVCVLIQSLLVLFNFQWLSLWVGEWVGLRFDFFFSFSLKCAAGQCCNDNAFDKNQTSWMSLWGKDDGHKSLYDDFDLNNCCVIIVMDSFYRAQIFFAKQKVQCAVTHHPCTRIYADIIYCLGNGLSRLVKSLSKEESRWWCTTSCHIYGILSFVSLSVLSRKILRCIHV